MTFVIFVIQIVCNSDSLIDPSQIAINPFQKIFFKLFLVVWSSFSMYGLIESY